MNQATSARSRSPRSRRNPGPEAVPFSTVRDDDGTTRAFRGFVQGHEPRRAASATGPITGARPHRAHTSNGRFYAIGRLGRNRTQNARATRDAAPPYTPAPSPV